MRLTRNPSGWDRDRRVVLADVVITVIQWVINLLTLAIFARVILSFASLIIRPPHPQWLINLDNFVISITEPILGPIRRMLPNMGGLDFSPMVVLIILLIVRAAVNEL